MNNEYTDWIEFLTEDEARALLYELWMERRAVAETQGDVTGGLTLYFLDTQTEALARLQEFKCDAARELLSKFGTNTDAVDELIHEICAQQASRRANSDDTCKLTFLLAHLDSVSCIGKELELV